MAIDKKIFEYLERHNMEMAEFLSKLVQIDSTDYEAENSSNEKTAQKYFFNCTGSYKDGVDGPRRCPNFLRGVL